MRDDLNDLAMTADEFVGFPFFTPATADPSQASPSFDATIRAKSTDLQADRLHAAIAALAAVRELMDEAIIRHHTPGDWRARMDAVLDEAPR